MRRKVKLQKPWALIVTCFSLCGCVQKMGYDGHLEIFGSPQMPGQESLVREPPKGTIARGQLKLDSIFFQGQEPGQKGHGPRLVEHIPIKITHHLLKRGQERFNIHCSPCHGEAGYGDGMIVQRGFLAPPSYHIARLRKAPDGHFFQVISQGYGAMYSYAERITTSDRWAIVAYIRALQLSQNFQSEKDHL